MTTHFQEFTGGLVTACRRTYRRRLVSVAIFGSYARGAATPVSDIDVLLVADPLPAGRSARLAEFEPVETATAHARSQLWPHHETIPPEISALIKTRTETCAGSPLFLDMTDWCDALFDRGGFLAGYLAGLRRRMEAAGSIRRATKGGYYWDYKPAAAPLEVVEL